MFLPERERHVAEKEKSSQASPLEGGDFDTNESYFEDMAVHEKTKEFMAIVEPVLSETMVAIDGEVANAVKEYDDVIASAGIEDVGELEKLTNAEKKFSGRFSFFREKCKKLVPFLIPLMFAAKIARREVNPEFFNARDRSVATEQLKREGITDERKTAYIPGVSELMYRGITPLGYQNTWDIIKNFPENLIDGREESVSIAQAEKGEEILVSRKSEIPEREDAWRFYLGLPQENDTFGVSEFKPANSKEDKYYYKINSWLEKFSQALIVEDRPGYLAVKEIVEAFDNMPEEGEQDIYWVKGRGDNYILSGDMRLDPQNPNKLRNGVMGNFKLSLGQDSKGHYISYYDKWDLGGSDIEGDKGLFGKPFEIYDRVYYNPDTHEVLPST